MRPEDRRTSVVRLVAWGLAIGCLGCATGPGCRKEPGRLPLVVLECPDGGEHRVRVEVAAREEDRARGLMYRKHLDPDAGMLFIYPVESEHSFWMKNTHIPLDMIFISENRLVVGLVQGAKPLALDHLSINAPSRFILEVNAGYAREHQIREGCRVTFEDIREAR